MIDLDKYEGHTPGPWQIGHGARRSNACMVFDNDSNLTGICNVYGIPMNTRAADCENAIGMPNARLIADAPALLAEVKRLRQDLHDTIRESQQYRAERDEAVEALRELSHYAETSDDCQYGTLSTRLVRDIANPVLAKHGASE